MLTIPEDFLVLFLIEDRRVNGGNVLPVLPASPVPSEVPGVTEHISTESMMSERVFAIGPTESVGVVVIGGVDDNVLGRTFTNHKVIRGLPTIIVKNCDCDETRTLTYASTDTACLSDRVGNGDS